MHHQSERQSPRQRVLSAFRHEQPERVPFTWGFGPTPEMARCLADCLAPHGIRWDRLRDLTEDVVGYAPAYIGPALPPRADIWGIRRRAMSYGAGQGLGQYDEFEHYPLAGLTVDEIEAYPWPDPQAYDYAHLREKVRAADPAGRRARKLNIDCVGNPFEIYCWMTGLEESLVNLALHPERVHAGMAHITRFFEHKLRRVLADCGDLFDILYMADDLGGQNGLLMSRRAYRALIQPYHRRLACAAHELAPRAAVMHHSDGAVFDILPDLIDAGVDALEAVQVDAAGMQPEALKRAYGDRMCFVGGISVQALLPHGDEAMVMASSRRLVEVFGAGGGYVAAPTHAIQVGTPPGNVLAMLRAVLGEVDYAAALAGATDTSLVRIRANS